MSATDSFENNNAVPVPHSLEELWGYFKHKEERDPSYTGFADTAANVADSIEIVRRAVGSSEPLGLNLPLAPNRSNGIWMHEQTPASRELIELIFAVNDLEPVIDETTDDNPYGKVLWRSRDPFSRISIIEHRWLGAKGDAMMLSVVSEVPNTLVDARSTPAYSEKDQKAIKRAIALQKAGSAAVNRLMNGEVEEEELDYHLLIEELPTASHESPGDQQIAA